MRKNNGFENTNGYTLEDIRELVVDFKRGNEYTFTTIFELTYPVLNACGKKYTRDEHVIQEAIQETFITVAKKVAQLSDENKFMNWTYVIFKNKVMEQFRKQKSIKEDSEDMSGTEYKGVFARCVCSKVDFNPEAKIIREELINRVGEAIMLLPATQRVALLAYAYDGKSMQEIAYMMDCPEGTIKSRLYNARRAIKEYLTE